MGENQTRTVGREEKPFKLANVVGSLNVDISKKGRFPFSYCCANINTEGVERFVSFSELEIPP